jgi:NAD(P)-dependent dehydrogenase (short-subunit alcohol dehydrogenase family)
MSDAKLDCQAVTLVTGGVQGIGAAIVRRFAAAGARLAINDIAPSAGRHQ